MCGLGVCLEVFGGVGGVGVREESGKQPSSFLRGQFLVMVT